MGITMSYIANEIDIAIKTNFLPHKKLSTQAVEKLTLKLIESFLVFGTKTLDPTNLRAPKKTYDPAFWNKIDKIIHIQAPILIVQDTKTHGWEFETSRDLTTLLSETTGYPFWITSKNLNFLTYMDDHDCVYTSKATPI
jgi:hypothetical protein